MIKNTILHKLLFILFLLPVSFISCSDSDEKATNTLEVNEKSINFLADKELTKTISVKSNSDWTANASEDATWCHVSKESINTLQVVVDPNKGAQKRSTKIEVKANDLKQTISVEQLGSDLDILIDNHFFNAQAIGDKLTLKVTTNTEYVFTLPEWIQEEQITTRAKEMIEYEHNFNIDANLTEENRQGVIEVHDKTKTITQKLVVSQKGLNEYDSSNKEGLLDDVKVQPVSASSTSEQPGASADKSIDGDLKTIYHSNWNNKAENYFPIELTYNFEKTEYIDYIIYYPRESHHNGNFEEVEIHAIYGDKQVFEKIMDIDLEGLRTPANINLPQSLKNPKSIKFIIKSGSGDGQGFATCAEMEFYQKNPEAFDYHTLFTDETCSELKSGISQEDIDNCKYPFYQNMAFFMLNNKYDTEFRIATFKAYPHPDIQSRINKTSSYSIMDNPTGISVKYGEEIVIFAEDLQGHKVSILLQNLDKPGGDGFGGPSFPISKGLNKFKAPHKGLIYVMYHNNPNGDLETYESYPDLKLHFASGSVNGYFDKLKHNKEDWNRLLNKTTSEYFDLVGEFAHITYPVSIFKVHTPDGLALIEAYDQLVNDEMEFMGLYKYETPATPRVFKNRMYFNVMYHSFMYAAGYRTGYNVSTLNELADVEKFKTVSIWGPAHEVGHVNQTRPGLKWVGMTEVTNNIHSQYIQTKFGNPSRLQSEDMGEGRIRFENAMTNMFPTKTFSYSSEPDVFCKLVPLWQVQLYFSWVLGNNDVYKDIYEDIRLNPDYGTNGKNQVWFAYRASKISGYDLTDFFDKWGFFVPIDEDIEDYSTERMTITPAIADEVKAAIKALNLPKPPHALEYITDRTSEFYKSNAKVTSGTVTVSNKKVSTTGCEKAVAIEVFDNDKLVFVATRPNFNLINALTNLETARFEAISADGSRVKLTKK